MRKRRKRITPKTISSLLLRLSENAHLPFGKLTALSKV